MLKKSERSLLYLLKLHSSLSRIKTGKEMFLISEKTGSYRFVPYKFGPFSFEMYRDIQRLEEKGYLTEDKDNFIYLGLPFPEPAERDKEAVEEVYREYGGLGDTEIMNIVYARHPEFTIFSEYERKEEYLADERGITTIGYEGKTLDEFLYTLIKNKINTLVDVRKNAFSRKYGFSKGTLKRNLEKLNIEYIHMPELGIVSDKRRELKTFEDYQALFREYYPTLDGKKESLNRLMEMGKERKIALMCFEADVNYCHRGQIAKWLRNEGAEVVDL